MGRKNTTMSREEDAAPDFVDPSLIGTPGYVKGRYFSLCNVLSHSWYCY